MQSQHTEYALLIVESLLAAGVLVCVMLLAMWLTGHF
jgi:hypothetical protein